MKYFTAFLPLLLSVPMAHAACPAADHLIRTYGISYSGFDKAVAKSEAQDKNKTLPADIVILPLWRDQPLVPDGFKHTAWINKKTRQAWILRTGGFAGVREWYGPVAVENVDFTGCATEPVPVPERASAR